MANYFYEYIILFVDEISSQVCKNRVLGVYFTFVEKHFTCYYWFLMQYLFFFVLTGPQSCRVLGQ